MFPSFLRFTLNIPHIGDLTCTECDKVIVEDMGRMTLATLLDRADDHLLTVHGEGPVGE